MYPVARLKTVGSLHLKGGPEIWNRDPFFLFLTQIFAILGQSLIIPVIATSFMVLYNFFLGSGTRVPGR